MKKKKKKATCVWRVGDNDDETHAGCILYSNRNIINIMILSYNMMCTWRVNNDSGAQWACASSISRPTYIVYYNIILLVCLQVSSTRVGPLKPQKFFFFNSCDRWMLRLRAAPTKFDTASTQRCRSCLYRACGYGGILWSARTDVYLCVAIYCTWPT